MPPNRVLDQVIFLIGISYYATSYINVLAVLSLGVGLMLPLHSPHLLAQTPSARTRIQTLAAKEAASTIMVTSGGMPAVPGPRPFTVDIVSIATTPMAEVRQRGK